MRDFQLPGRSAVFASNGMCATSHPLAAKTAIDVLQDGGNAVDAAIAAGLLLGICEPQSTGIGGDCFFLIKPAGEERIVGVNGSGRAPAAMNAEELRADGHKVIPLESPAAITIPGAMDAFVRVAKDWGTMGLDRVLAPAIRYADGGVPVGPRSAVDWKRNEPRLNGAARQHFLFDDKAPKPGQLFRAPGQADVLRRVVRDGRAGFYEGEVAEDMVASLQALGGNHVADDFAATACEYVDPISDTYRGTELVELPPNGQGATALLMAKILAQFELTSDDPLGVRRAHLEAEAAKLAYNARDRFVADADMPNSRLAHMLSDGTAEQLAALIDPDRAMDAPAQLSEAVHKDTVYLCVVDKDRMAVSLIYSIFHAFGSGLASKKFGIGFQNRGAGFSLQPGHPNEAGGGKRPMHTIIPAMLRRGGKQIMPFGVMGGQYQPNGHVRVLSNMVDFDMHPQQALDAPRSFAEGGVLSVERGYGEDVRTGLAALGHQVEIPEAPLGGAQAILIDDEMGVLQGASDPRKDGCALGY